MSCATDVARPKTIIACGHGRGTSAAVARKLGAAGFAVALVARSADKFFEVCAARPRLRGVSLIAAPHNLRCWRRYAAF